MPKNFSHESIRKDFLQAYRERREVIIQAGNDDLSTVEERLAILEELAKIPLGRFLIANRGMNGFWTHYVCTGFEKQPINELELFLIKERPLALATQERFRTFIKLAQQELKPKMRLASIPSGLMGDLLSLDYSSALDTELTAIDLDSESLVQAEELAQTKKIRDRSRFLKKNAWDLGIRDYFDVITSSGLNIYVSESEKVVALYTEFYDAMKPDSLLITSFMPPPPWIDARSSWKLSEIDSKALQRQRIVYEKVLGFRGSCYQTKEDTKRQLENVGFKDILFHEDRAGIFPTVTARKMS